MSSVRHDWYQTQQKVVIDILIKNAKERNCSVDIQSNIVLIRGDDISLDFHLAHEIDTAKSSFRILNVKIEISLQKLVGEAWSSLQNTNESTASFAPFPTQKPPEFYPRKGDKNWESIVKDVCEKEEIEKEDAKALNNLFEKIYSESDPAVQRAMNKSFTESGGTVLSTNWNEVGAGKVEVKPPSGTEFREWEK